mgnify:CR=1 FL=1
MISRNDPCWCGSGKKWKKCHYPQLPPPSQADVYKRKYNILLKTPEQIEGIRRAAAFSARTLCAVCSEAKKGVTTNELNDYVVQLAQKEGARPAPLGYGDPPFPKAICTSLNEEICHGIPDDRPLQEGDSMNIDVSFELGGYYGDCSAMVCIGAVSAEKQLVVDVARESLDRAIAVVRPGVPLSEIGRTIEDYATSRGCSVVNEFVGHGIGIEFHEPPQVPHHYNTVGIELTPGMTFTIEPMINAGVRKAVIDADNGWIARTADGRPSAQWEHQLLVTETGCDVLTAL